MKLTTVARRFRRTRHHRTPPRPTDGPRIGCPLMILFFVSSIVLYFFYSSSLYPLLSLCLSISFLCLSPLALAVVCMQLSQGRAAVGECAFIVVALVYDGGKVVAPPLRRNAYVFASAVGALSPPFLHLSFPSPFSKRLFFSA